MASQGDRVGPWTLDAKCGSGGNAVVWEAFDDRGERAALKLINAVNAGREPYRRFITEIETLRAIGAYEGVVPVLAAHLPVSPTAHDRPWLAMRLAEPLSRALESSDLATIVRAVQTVADTLARLRDDHGIAHRDVKPANLYRLDDSWCIGDFGLVALPDRDGLTQDGRPLGPAHYVPDEMLLDPVGADPHSADVYSLAKTLWVLACRQNFPPQGHQPSTILGNGIADFNPHPHAAAIDRLVDRMTVRDPVGRPSVRQVADELEAWLQLTADPPIVDLTAARLRLREALSTELVALDVAEQRREFALAAVRDFNRTCAPISEALRNLHPKAKIDQTTDQRVDRYLESPKHWGGPVISWRWARLSTVSIGSDHREYDLRLGRALELTADGDLLLHRFIDAGHPRYGASDFSWNPPPLSAAVGTIEVDGMLERAVAEIAANLQIAADKLADHAVGMLGQGSI